jgi:hypothetical protein
LYEKKRNPDDECVPCMRGKGILDGKLVPQYKWKRNPTDKCLPYMYEMRRNRDDKCVNMKGRGTLNGKCGPSLS